MALVMPQLFSPILSFEPLAGPSSRRCDPSLSPELDLAEDHCAASRCPSDNQSAPAVRKPREKRYKCQYEGCENAYTKPSRLEEHEASHRGERAHICPTCGTSYLRQDHLRAHIRTHLNQEDRPYGCTRPGCDKRFWTAQHVRRHEEMHDKVEAQSITCDQCSASFAKAKQLRDHIASVHMPEGTKPFICEHPGCGASFAMKQKLKNHVHIHDVNRYTCSDLSHPSGGVAFPTWSALQKHMHEAHPPFCPRPECKRRTFKSHARLKDHEKVHRERDADLAAGRAVAADMDGRSHLGHGRTLVNVGQSREGPDQVRKRKRESRASDLQAGSAEEGEENVKLPRVIGGDAGKTFACGREGCGKKFKTKYALTTHTRATHLAIRHACPVEGCDNSFSHLSNLRRHLLGVHRGEGSQSAPALSALPASPPVDGFVAALDYHTRAIALRPEETMMGAGPVVVSQTTGKDGPKKAARRRLECPAHLVLPTSSVFYESSSEAAAGSSVRDWSDSPIHPTPTLSASPLITPFAAPYLRANESSSSTLPNAGNGVRCQARFWRVYDMRWHLRKAHGVEIPDDELRALLQSMKTRDETEEVQDEEDEAAEDEPEVVENMSRNDDMGGFVLPVLMERPEDAQTQDQPGGAEFVQVKEEPDF